MQWVIGSFGGEAVACQCPLPRSPTSWFAALTSCRSSPAPRCLFPPVTVRWWMRRLRHL